MKSRESKIKANDNAPRSADRKDYMRVSADRKDYMRVSADRKDYMWKLMRKKRMKSQEADFWRMRKQCQNQTGRKSV